MGFDVFISYSRKNMAVADQVNRHLTQMGLQCFQDRRSIRVALWGQSAEDTAQSVARFIESGLLDRYLAFIWKEE